MTKSDYRYSEERRAFLIQLGACAITGLFILNPGCAKVKKEWREKIEGKKKEKKPEPWPAISSKISVSDQTSILAATRIALAKAKVVAPPDQLTASTYPQRGVYVTHINGRSGYYVYEIDGNRLNSAMNSVDQDPVGSASRITWYHIYDFKGPKKQVVLEVNR